MDFLLHNMIFDQIINFFIFINIMITCIFSFKEFKSKETTSNNESTEENKRIYLIKMIIIIIWFIVIVSLIIFYSFKYNFISYFSLFLYLSFIWLTFKIRKKNMSDLSYENKMYYIQATYLYLIFFSSKSTSIYLETFINLPHSLKEYMLVTFLIIKLLFFIFCIIVNYSILISNLKNIFNKHLSFIKLKIVKCLNKTFEFNFYNFHFSKNKKSKILFIIDVLIYILLCPITIIINLVIPLLTILTKFLLKKILVIGNKITHYLDNSSKIIEKTIKISLIFSLVIVYGIIVYYPTVISDQTKDIYNLIITVVLIPLVYDNIKQKQ